MQPPLPSLEWCLFLDFDGTLIELTDSPFDASVDESLKVLLAEIAAVLGGAVALVSGRQIALLDALVAPLRLPTSGLHGVERRGASGATDSSFKHDSALDDARQRIATFVATHPGSLLEDKGRTIGLHYRLAPAAAAAAHRLAHDIVSRLDGRFHVQAGNMLYEIKPDGVSKGTAINEFLREAPFAGRTPVFLGDDITDQDGFEAVERHGGIAIAVGERVRARYKLAGPEAVRSWLQRIAALRA